MTPFIPTQLAVDAAGDVFGQFPGAGVVELFAGGGQQTLTTTNAALVENDVFGDVFVELPGQGFFRFLSGAGLQLLPGTEGDASLLA